MSEHPRRMSLDDAWMQAQNVRMWLETARDGLGAPKRKAESMVDAVGGWFSRRFRLSSRDEVAIDAINRLKVVFVDLEFALHRAGMEQIALETLRIEFAHIPGIGIGKALLDAPEVSAAVVRDLATVDRLLERLEARQRPRPQ